MKLKLVKRYVAILSNIIDRKIRVEGKNATFDKSYISHIIEDIDDKVTEKTYKESAKWFLERNIFKKIGQTFNAKYQLHPNFKYKLSKSRETVEKQCKFIIGQLTLFSDQYWDEAESLYNDVVTADGFFEFIPTIKPKRVSDTVSKLILNRYNEDYKSCYHYELLQTLILLRGKANIQIQNSSLDISLKDVRLKKVIFNYDNITVEFDKLKVDINSLLDIKTIDMLVPNDIFDRIDETISYLEKIDKDVAQKMKDLIFSYKLYGLFFQEIT